MKSAKNKIPGYQGSTKGHRTSANLRGIIILGSIVSLSVSYLFWRSNLKSSDLIATDILKPSETALSSTHNELETNIRVEIEKQAKLIRYLHTARLFTIENRLDQEIQEAINTSLAKYLGKKTVNNSKFKYHIRATSFFALDEKHDLFIQLDVYDKNNRNKIDEITLQIKKPL